MTTIISTISAASAATRKANPEHRRAVEGGGTG